MRISKTIRLLPLLPLAMAAADKTATGSALDRYVAEAEQRAAAERRSLPGSLWHPGAALADLGRDVKASQVDDIVTILVSDRASAVSKGSTQSSRASSAQYSANALFGLTRAAGPFANMAGANGSYDLDGQGATSRENSLTTTLSARVTAVLPNGYLVVEGVKNVVVNSEAQLVRIRGVVRPIDVTPGNLVRSDRLGELEVTVNGKGVVGDAIRRPFILYRLLLGLLPF